MPFEARKYSGLDYFTRAACASVLCMSLTTLLTYPLDTIHTRTSVDMTKTGQTRLFSTTFDCFCRSNLDEGRYGLYKGVEFAVASSLLRACFTMPVYEVFSKNQPESKMWNLLGASVTTGLILSTVLYPLDTMKKCMQLNGSRGQLSLYNGYIESFLKLPSSLGFSGLYRGVHVFCIS
jgi:hypothetical protein